MENVLIGTGVATGKELTVEGGKDYYLGNRIFDLIIGIRLGRNKSSSILLTTAPARKSADGYILPKVTFKNRVGTRKLYSNYGLSDDNKGGYELCPETTYEINIKAYAKDCIIKIQAVDAVKAITDGTIPYYSSTSSSDSSSSESESSNDR